MSAKAQSKVNTPPAGVRKTGWTDGVCARAAERRAEWRSGALTSAIEAGTRSWGGLLFPTPKVESWKYTNPEVIANGSFALAAPPTSIPARGLLDPFVLKGAEPFLLVLVNGHYEPSLSFSGSLEGLQIRVLRDLADGSRESTAKQIGRSNVHVQAPFAALSTAIMSEVVCIEVARGSVVTTPIQVLSVTTPEGNGSVQATRVVITVAENAQVIVVESHVSLGAEEYLSLPVTEAFVEEGGVLDHYRVGLEADSAFHIGHTVIEQARNSNGSTMAFSFGGKLVRNSIDFELKGSGSCSTVNGLSVLKGEQHVDNSTCIHHIEPHCESRELFKGIYADTSRGVFSGTIVVESEAQKTNAFQSNQSLLLSPTASIETRPQLKIWADDVKCTHGATVGQLDGDAMFYLQSRGIGREDARNFLLHAFAGEVVSSVRLEPLRGYITELIELRMSQLSST
jgi:Fe-S cluster assembly protein SufD